MDRYCRWREQGYMSSNGRCFDIGGTVSSALRRYRQTGHPFSGSTAPETAGNGCIMRLAPVPLFFYPDVDRAREVAAESARTTHGAPECLDASRLLAGTLCRALAGESRERVLLGDSGQPQSTGAMASIANGDYLALSEHAIRGSGYVVDCLRAALWSFATTDSFAAAVRRAANLGDDADTTAAVCGQIAGAFYGEGSIPAAWLAVLTMRQEIAGLADALGRGPAV
jgi:ADP-ribosyl-[dinitrogen reductase] hydrolase